MSNATPKTVPVRMPAGGVAEAIVDAEDYPSLIEYTWRFDGVRVMREISKTVDSKRIRRCMRMHRQIMQAKPGEVIDHINRNPLDNRKENLRKCTQGQNTLNSCGRANRRSKFKGVYPAASRKNPWRAQICIGGKVYHLGIFATQEEAAHAWNEGAKKLHGEFACLNELDETA